jgi:hypothetical protein
MSGDRFVYGLASNRRLLPVLNRRSPFRAIAFNPYHRVDHLAANASLLA